MNRSSWFAPVLLCASLSPVSAQENPRAAELRAAQRRSAAGARREGEAAHRSASAAFGEYSGAGLPGGAGPAGPASRQRRGMPRADGLPLRHRGEFDFDGEAVAPVSDAANVTPYQRQADLAQKLLMVGGMVLAVAVALSRSMNPAMLSTAKTLAYAAAAMGTAVLSLGLMVVAQGQKLQGFMYTVSGGMLMKNALDTAHGIGARQQKFDACKAAREQWLAAQPRIFAAHTPGCIPDGQDFKPPISDREAAAFKERLAAGDSEALELAGLDSPAGGAGDASSGAGPGGPSGSGAPVRGDAAPPGGGLTPEQRELAGGMREQLGAPGERAFASKAGDDKFAALAPEPGFFDKVSSLTREFDGRIIGEDIAALEQMIDRMDPAQLSSEFDPVNRRQSEQFYQWLKEHRDAGTLGEIYEPNYSWLPKDHLGATDMEGNITLNRSLRYESPEARVGGPGVHELAHKFLLEQRRSQGLDSAYYASPLSPLFAQQMETSAYSMGCQMWNLGNSGSGFGLLYEFNNELGSHCDPAWIAGHVQNHYSGSGK